MTRLVVAMVTLALTACAPAWAQERRLKHELRPDHQLAERPELEFDQAPEGDELDAGEAAGAEEAGEAPDEEFGDVDLVDPEPGDAAPEDAEPDGEESADAASAEEEELVETWAIPPDAGRPEPSGVPGGPTFQEQLGTLIVDLQLDRASGRQYARAPERGKESLIQEVSLAIPQQLLANECWAEEDAVVAGRRDTIAIAVRYDVDGRFVEEPRLVSPPEMPADDPPLRRFIERTFSALKACNANGIKLPAKYYEDPIWVYFILQSRPE